MADNEVRSTINKRTDGKVYIVVWNQTQTLHTYVGRDMEEWEILAKERELVEEYSDGY